MMRLSLTAIATLLFLLIVPTAAGSIVIYVSDDGDDLTFHMTGTMDLSGITAQHTFVLNEDRGTSNQLFSASSLDVASLYSRTQTTSLNCLFD